MSNAAADRRGAPPGQFGGGKTASGGDARTGPASRAPRAGEAGAPGGRAPLPSDRRATHAASFRLRTRASLGPEPSGRHRVGEMWRLATGTVRGRRSGRLWWGARQGSAGHAGVAVRRGPGQRAGCERPQGGRARRGHPVAGPCLRRRACIMPGSGSGNRGVDAGTPASRRRPMAPASDVSPGPRSPARPASPTYHHRYTARRKTHTQTLFGPARHHIGVLAATFATAGPRTPKPLPRLTADGWHPHWPLPERLVYTDTSPQRVEQCHRNERASSEPYPKPSYPLSPGL
jgi:hypothetical protein